MGFSKLNKSSARHLNFSCFPFFFQDAEEADENDGTNDFFKFEKCLVKCAKEKKKQLLEKQASSVISKLNEK